MTQRTPIATTEYGMFADISGDADHTGFCVMATTAEGEIYIHERCDLDEDDAKNLAKVVGLAKQITPERWAYWRTVYGSAAFLEEEEEAAQAADMIRRGQAHEEDFAGTAIGGMI